MSLETELAIQVFDGFTLLDYKVSKRFAFRSIKKRQISSIFRIVTARTPVLKTGARKHRGGDFTIFVGRFYSVLMRDCDCAVAWTILANMNVKKCDCKCIANALDALCWVRARRPARENYLATLPTTKNNVAFLTVKFPDAICLYNQAVKCYFLATFRAGPCRHLFDVIRIEVI